MFKVSALALVVALCNAATGSRLLLQTTTGAPVTTAAAPANVPPSSGTGAVPPELPPVNIPPSTGAVPPAIPPAQPQPPARPQQPAYNPMNNPYCNPMSGMYDAQDCAQTSFMYGQQGQAPGVNMNNPYCNPASGMYDLQDCIQYGGMYQNAGAPGQGQAGGVNMNNPYCNPMSGMYDAQDCYQTSFMYQGYGQQPSAPAGNPAAPGQAQRPGAANPINPMNPYCNPYSGNYDIQDCYRSTYGFFI